MKHFSLLLSVFVLLTFFIVSTASAVTIFAPMIDSFEDFGPNIDEWYMVADASGTISVDLYDHEAGGATLSIDGGPSVASIAGTTVTVSKSGLVAGSTHVFTREIADFGGGTHYRPKFDGVDAVYIKEDRVSPNDTFNNSTLPSGGGSTGFAGSNIELGFDGRFDHLPSAFADTTWFYALDVGDTITWTGIFDDFPGGADAVAIEMFDGTGTLQASAFGPPLLGVPGGTTFTDTVLAGEEGFWSVKLTAPSLIEPHAGHYLMDVEVTDSFDMLDFDKSERHYLLPGSLLDPEIPIVPEPSTIALLGIGLAGLAGAAVRRRLHHKIRNSNCEIRNK